MAVQGAEPHNQKGALTRSLPRCAMGSLTVTWGGCRALPGRAGLWGLGTLEPVGAVQPHLWAWGAGPEPQLLPTQAPGAAALPRP